jgi:outer membrane protein OmpA-like peptidoglycan-associated protein
MNRAMLTALAAAMIITGCSTLSDLEGMHTTVASLCGHSKGIVLVIGAHRNVPAPSLDQRLKCQLAAQIRAGQPVRIVVASGQPWLISPQLIRVSGGTLAEQNSPWVQKDLQHIQAAVTVARATSPGVDDLAALSIAADAMRSAGAPHAEVALLDSGLDDSGVLDFIVPGMLAAAPAEVASQLKAAGNLPDLRGLTVLLVGIGYSAPPQTPLSEKWRSNLTQIWATVVRSAGATVQIVPQPAQGASVPTDQPVKLIPVPQDQPVRPITRNPIVFTGASPVRFEPNSTVLVDPAAALRALKPIAKWLASDPSRRALLVGTTADVGPMIGQIKLSELRADRIRNELVALGTLPAQISTSGVGSNFAQFTPDRNDSGALLAGPATLNRSVRITLCNAAKRC